ncbi:MAG: ABC transporter substrate-binding protein [Microscillaceae bacterium]|jgi:iron complex transport system substrate-binding protein|nr:ABC transporter substrate-binding protein [Microscillaceae bacterium]
MMRLKILIYSLLSWFLTTCGNSSSQEKTLAKAKELTESSTEQELNELAKLPRFNRIVCIGESIVEVVMALGDSAKIVAIDRPTLLFPQLKTPKVGYKGTLKTKYILDQKPDLVLSEWDGCSAEIADEVQQKGITFFRLRKDFDLSANEKFIRQIAAILKKPKRGAKIITDMQAIQSEIGKILKNRQDSVRVLFVHARGPQVLLSGGIGSATHELIKLAGGKNVAVEFEGMERLSPEDFTNLQPQFIIMSKKGFGTIASRLYEVPELVSTFAYRTGRVLFFDDRDLMNPGLRTSKLALDLAKQFYQQQMFAPLPAVTLPTDDLKNEPKVETKKKEELEIIKEENQ